ncbi:hypothetical protein MTR67_041607 [Solanum verrucosum]|uniref:ABC transporter domain-containing protein n=1 Tax=Solanum verrucosum TaxID=315347 RepID=A0AAF0UL90_SOLVR|nr:hypothetical protein MTR67_041607 [Solanum verrucosum]
MEPANLGNLRGSSLRGSISGSRRGSASLRANSNSIWRNTGVEIFSRSARDEDDEEALKWAALEKLPTFDRLRKGLLFGSQGAAAEIDINDIGYQERKNLLERLVKVAEEDNEKFLLKLKNRIDRVGIDLPTIEVRYENLNIEADAYVGSRGLPTFLNFMTNFLETLLNTLHILPSSKRQITILKDISGIIKPCRMTLLLGPPSSGKTTLLLALAGKLDSSLKVTGKVSYNGHELHEFVPQRTAAYISQHDLHIGEMTVRETLEFSARCQGVGSRYEMLAELSRREKAANIKPDPDIDIYMKASATEGQEANVVTDYVLKILGLDICADTMVGDEMLRGISGGQKKRVTTGEMLVGPSKALFMDEISTGLDSSTTYSIVNSLRQSVQILKGTAVISLLQPAPETYNLFDDIILISDGYIVYQGPRDDVLEFFESMGFKCPERKGVADFLQEVTSKKDQPQYWSRRNEHYRFISSKEFSDTFQSFHVGRKLGDELAIPFDRTKCHPAALTNEKYGIGKKELLKVCTEREYLLMKRNSFVYVFKFFQLTIMALMTMTLFFRTEMPRDTVDDGGIYAGALFFVVVMIMFNGMSEMAMTIFKLPVFYKQRDLLFFPSWAYAIPSWILKIPVTLVEVGLWVILTYYVIGFDPNITRPGVLTALMGVSGAGKTTLMDVLAGRKTGGYIDGDIKISGYPKKQETFARISGYCEQNDIHSPYVTVYESLVYSAWLRLPKDVDEKTRKMFVDEVMELVELEPLRSALVGLPGVNGLSTEQRKRLTIAVELVANPSIIFMDEPTSGLDARAAAIVMRTVRNTVDTGRTVVCTIHQPSIDIFEAFDELFLMKRGGQEIYVGPLGRHSCHLIKYFESIPGVAKIKEGYNPATWMLEVTASAQEMMLGVDFTDLYKNSDLYRRNKALITELSVPRPGSKDLYFETQYSQSLWIQCMACLWKQNWSYWRNPAYTAVRFIFTMFIALVFGTMFWDIGTKVSQSQDLFNAMGSMYAAVLFLGVQNASSVQPVVDVERTVFYRERAAGMYSAIPYAFGQVFIEIPYVFVQAIVYGIIVYAMIGFEWEVGKFFWYLFIMYTTLLYFTFYGMMSVAVTPNQNVASIVAAFFYAIWNLFSGFIVPRPRMPIWWRWYYWCCPVAWTLYGLVASQFGDIQTPLGNETVEKFLRRYFGFRHDFLPVVAGVLVAYVVVFAFTFAFAIKAFNFQRR